MVSSETLSISALSPDLYIGIYKSVFRYSIVNVWTEYAKGIEDGVELTFEAYDKTLDMWCYISREYGNNCMKLLKVIDGSFNPVIPVPFPWGADSIKVKMKAINATELTGNLRIEVRPDGHAM